MSIIRYRVQSDLADRDLPMLGHYLASERGRRAYLVTGVRFVGPSSRHPGWCTVVLTVDKVSRDDMAYPGAVSHLIVWDKRGERAA